MKGDQKLLQSMYAMDERMYQLTGEYAVLHYKVVHIGPFTDVRVTFDDMHVAVNALEACEYLQARLAVVEAYAWH